MPRNKGKKFENCIQLGFEKVQDLICWDRVKDNMGKLKGVKGICDFISFYRGNLFYLECKSTKGKSLSFANFTETQFEGLIQKSVYPNVRCGALIWFVDHDVNVWIDIRVLDKFRRNSQKKSINLDDIEKIPHVDLKSEKNRVYFKYDMLVILEDILREKI